VRAPIVIIGAGLAGLAAGIRLARAGRHPLIIEQHDKPGGLNSYYFRQGMLLETGLHAMTNFAPPELRHAPLNRLFRQLKLSRKNFITHEQILSEIRVQGGPCLCFSNDFSLLRQQIVAAFPEATDGFQRLIQALDDYDPFTPAPWRSTRQELCALLDHEVLRNLLLWPIMLYGNASEDDMDFAQFVILFRAIFQEGLFRPADTMKDFLDLLLDRYRSLGGEIRFRTPVAGLTTRHDRIIGVELISGESLACEAVLSTAGLPATRALLGDAGQADELATPAGNISFFESIFLLPGPFREKLAPGRTMVFSFQDTFQYHMPVTAVDTNSCVVCLSDHFQGRPAGETCQVRVTHLANFDLWRQATAPEYAAMKAQYAKESAACAEALLGAFYDQVLFQDSFTPITIQRFSGKDRGAVYGAPRKHKDGCTPFANLVLAGTDQGFLGIIGAMMSGVVMANQHFLAGDSHAA